MLATYAATLAVCGASLAIGQAAVSLCGVRRWSWLSPAVGLALLCAVCWGTVRLPGNGVVSALVVVALCIASVAFLWGRLEGGSQALWIGLPVAVVALAAASLPFLAEGHFGILGTSFNPDMSQHLLATDRLVHGVSSLLLHQGYPLGPHAIVATLENGLGIGLVQGFDGLAIAVAVLAPLTALAAFSDRSPWLAGTAALLVGFAYMVASYFAQGAFKETMQALLVLAFVLALRESTRTECSRLSLRFVPAALIAAGSIYVYSFPGLIWLLAALVLWLLLERALPVRPLLLALLVFAILIAPELGRMIDFHSFETFDPNGPGLGNLFGQISPFTALGIWPSGDFRVEAGGGAVPAFAFFLGAAFAAILLVYGLYLCWRRRETAVLAGVLAAALAYAAARLGGTPYTAAKALEMAAPLAALAILVPLLRRPVAGLYLLAAGGCSLLALANAPVGPVSYTTTLNDFRRAVGEGPTLVVASPKLLEEEHGTPYLAWELRGGRVCIRSSEDEGGLPRGVRFLITQSGDISEGIERVTLPTDLLEVGRAPRLSPFTTLAVRPPWALLKVRHPTPGSSDCPLIAVRQARQGPEG